MHSSALVALTPKLFLGHETHAPKAMSKNVLPAHPSHPVPCPLPLEPFGQAMHPFAEARPDTVENLAGGQRVHRLEFGALVVGKYVPAVQSSHDVAACVLPWLPALHSVQFVAPGVSVYRPRGQARQSMPPFAGLYRPGVQDKHEYEDGSEAYFPAAQARQAVAPWMSLNAPGSHCRHTVAFEELLNSPTLQGTHAPASDTPRVMLPYLPGGHAVHLLEFGEGEYCPAGHPSQLNASDGKGGRTALYPIRQTHCASAAPAGESE